MQNPQNNTILTPKIKLFQPKGIICRDGIWALQAALLFAQIGKSTAADLNKKMEEILDEFLCFLIDTPELEVFTIDCHGGMKQPIDRDYLKGRGIRTDLYKDVQPSDHSGELSKKGKHIFVNKDQFLNILADKPVNEGIDFTDKSQKDLTDRERKTYQRLIGVLLGTLLGKSSNGTQYSKFTSQSSIIDSIHASYGKEDGFSKRNLEAKFAEAQRILKEES